MRSRLATASLLDLGIDPSSLPSDALRRIRTLTIGTLAMCLIGILYLPRYWALGLSDVAAALLVTLALGLANLALLRWTRRPELCGHIATTLLAAVLIVSNIASGGFFDPNFGWFYLLPFAAAVLVGSRGAWVWLGLTLAIGLVFWWIDVSGSPLPNRIPEEMREAHALFNRSTAILGLGFIAWSFVAGQRRAEWELQQANRELRRETCYVQLLEHAAVSANEASTLDDAMREAIRRICLTMSWPVGHVYQLADDGGLRSGGVFHAEDLAHFESLLEKTLEKAFLPGEGLPGRALTTGRPQARYDLLDQPGTERAALASRLGLRASFAIPVLVHGRVTAVMEFASREPMEPNQRLLEVLAHVGIQVGRVAERTLLQSRLRQSQKMEAVGRLAAGVSHEINNPMAYVRSNLNQLRKQWGDLRRELAGRDSEPTLATPLGECEELIEEALDGVERTVAIVRDMKEFSRLGSGEREPADLREIVEGAVRVASTHARAGIEIREWHQEGLPRVLCAQNQLRQVFVNLIVNAIEAVGEAGVVEVQSLLEGPDVVVRVRDDGPGIPASARESLFDPFFTTKPEGEGTGLGLSISYEIVQAHGGEIRVPPSTGEGTVIDVRLPRAAVAESRI